MFAFLSKKIAIPNQIKVQAIAWSQVEGLLAVGGERGLLKILKIDDGRSVPLPQQKDEKQPQNPLMLNQTLVGHEGNVQIVSWNENYTKLTTADDNGLIIVWKNEDGKWTEEMVNNRKKSIVKDMKWSTDGQCVCIIYEDGTVIVGSVSGQRIWGKELKFRLHLIEWSPDNRFLVFGTPEGEVKIFDCNGNPIMQLKIYCVQKQLEDEASLLTPKMPLAAIQWYEGAKMNTDDTPPGLIIAYECGRIQLMKNEMDDDPILIDTRMIIHCVRWNPQGTIFAISGSFNEGSEDEPDIKGQVQYFSNQGIHLRTLKITNSDKVGSVSWEANGLRLAMSVDASVFYANIKPDYKWGYMNGTVVFAYQKQDRVDFCVIFWDTKSDQKNFKYVKNLVALKAEADCCILISKVDEKIDQYLITLCNSIGSPVDTKQINVEPIYVRMTKTHVIVCSYDHVYVWQYKTQIARLTTFESATAGTQVSQKKFGREIAFFIDESPSTNQIYDKDRYDVENKSTEDPVCAITAQEDLLIIGRSKGSVHKYNLPVVALDSKVFVSSTPQIMTLNCNSSRLAIVDVNGVLSIWEFTSQGFTQLQFEKRDIWDIKWSEDDPKQFVFMEKLKMWIVKDVEPEEPVSTEAYICEFKEMQVKSVFLDDIMKIPDALSLKTNSKLIQVQDTKALSQIKELLAKVSFKQAYDYIEQNPHPKLWRILGEKSLEELDFGTAEKSFAACEDYQSIQFVKKLHLFDDKNKQRAEIMAFYGKFDEAEDMYRKAERKDLAIQMRMKIGDWLKCVQIVREGAGNDEILTKAYDELGNQYADRFKWQKAAQYYELSKNYKQLMECYYYMESFDKLEELIDNIPDQSDILIELGERFQSVGMCDAAVKAYTKARDIKKAIDCCVLLNQWNLAVDLAERNNFAQIESLLTVYANKLLEKKKKLECVELYRRANRNTEAAKLLSQIAEDLVSKDVIKNFANPLLIKKLFVMAALEVDLYKKRVIDATLTGQGMTTAKTLDSLITSDINTSADKALTNPWRGAEAWHFFILAQKHLYSGDYKLALKSSIRLMEYELELDTKKVYSLVALAAYYNNHFKECSRAFVKLETLTTLSQEEREKFEELAIQIFSKYPPQEPKCEIYPCPGKQCREQVNEYETHCKSCGVNFQVCIASGRSILAKEYYSCKACKHKILESEIQRLGLRFCALCHAVIERKNIF